MLSRCFTRRLTCINAKCIQQAVCRAAFSSAAAAPKPVKNVQCTFDMSKLVRALEEEIQYNREFIETESKLEAVTEKHEKMLNEQGWSVSSPEDTTMVELSAQRGDMKIVVKFDAEMVADSLNSQMENEEFDEDVEEAEARTEEEFEQEDMLEDDGHGHQPFTFSVELHRPDALPEKFIEMELEAVPGPTEEGGDQLYINSIHVRQPKHAAASEIYSGPQYDTLDEELRSKFDGWADKNLRHLIPFIAEFSQAKETKEYGKWLADLKTIATPKQ